VVLSSANENNLLRYQSVIYIFLFKRISHDNLHACGTNKSYNLKGLSPGNI